jgi:1-acyl-sn-glycerol-3-phosphate acyltransferase
MTLLKTCLRLISKAISFTVFGLGSLIIGLIFIPVINLVIRDKKKRMTIARSIIGTSMYLFLLLMTILGLLKYRTYGMENINPDENYLILANHPSLIDVIFLISLFPQSYCVVKTAIFKNPLIGNVVSSANYIPNEDTEMMLKRSIESLELGGSLILFPEATRSRSGRQLEFKQAAATIAIRSGQKCLPIIIRPDSVALTKEKRWWQTPAERTSYRIEVQKPIDPLELKLGNSSSRRPDRDFNKFLENYFKEKLEISQT